MDLISYEILYHLTQELGYGDLGDGTGDGTGNSQGAGVGSIYGEG